MKKIAAAAAGVALALGLALSAHATAPPDHKVTLCHRTGSATNPYVEVTVDIASSGYVKGGHTGHDQVGNGLGGDIIPAYDYVRKDGSTFSYAGKNLDAVIGGETGAEILAAGCVIADESPSPTPTETGSPTPTPPTKPPTRTHTPTWTPTWTPTHRPPTNSAGVRRTAFTGSDATRYAVIAGALAALGLGATFLARRRSTG